MGRTVAIGVQDFGELIRNNYFYVDKTSFIREWWESGDSVTLITRPRRFGKTLTMSMLDYFFSVRHFSDESLFHHLSVWADANLRELQGRYPVLFLTFAGVKETGFDNARYNICQLITDLYSQYGWLLETNVLSETDRDFYRRVHPEMADPIAGTAVRKLCSWLKNYYEMPCILLLDEYDTPLHEAYINGYWDEMAAFLRNFFNNTFKTNPAMERAVMTGITRVGRESMFSDLNNLELVTTTSAKYAKAFGFTEEEVFAAMDEMQLTEREEVKRWYDGFIFGDIPDIYNPWSIIHFLDKRKVGEYWANTSENSLVGKLIREADAELKSEFEELLRGGTISSVINEEIVFGQLRGNASAIWSLFLASGYLKAVSHEDRAQTGRAKPLYRLALTNLEVQIMFDSMIAGWFDRAEGSYNQFIRALLAGDLREMNRYMNRVTVQTFSYFDTGTKPSGIEPERFYHGFVLGLLVELAGRYELRSNRESGYGRYDVLLKPKSTDDCGYILEFKVHDPEEEKTLEETVAAAHRQIERKCYETELAAAGIPAERIRKYGFAFEGKRVLIG